jgi:two-component system, chemotaxis family, chemotaxis protein CheY
MEKSEIPSGKESACVSTAGRRNPWLRRILVVDDDSDTRQLSIDVLVSSDYVVDAVVDGASAWEALKAKHFDLVITDNKMPRMTGVELIEKLRYTRLPLPVIMATSEVPTTVFERKPWLLPDATLERPFSNDELLAAVRKVLRTDDGNLDHMEMLLPRYL